MPGYNERFLDDIFADSFEELLEEDKSMSNDPELIYIDKKPPVDIIEFIESSEFLGLGNTVYPRVKEILYNIEHEDVRESILLLGKGSGKTTSLEIYILYGAYKLLCMKNPQKYYGLLNNFPMALLLVSISGTQAKEVGFKGTSILLENAKWFRNKYKLLSSEIRFDKNITFYSGNSQATSWLGFNTVRAAMDETEFLVDNNNRSVAQELYRALIGSLRSRYPDLYKLLLVSSPKAEFSFLNTRFNQIKRDGERIELKGRDN